jgi:hypothetical protein
MKPRFNSPILFESKSLHGRTMNQFGVVIDGAGDLVTPEVSGRVVKEAMAAGWTRQEGDEYRDVGLVWTPPVNNKNEKH